MHATRVIQIAGVLLLLTLTAPAVLAQENDLCMMCHSDISVFEGYENAATLAVDQDEFTGSSHGAAAINCVDCHMDLAGFEDFPHAEELEPVMCAMCHDQQALDHDESLHGQAQARGDELAPSCADCHGSHNILSHLDENSPTFIMNIPMLCGECHHEGTPVSRMRNIPQDQILENYSLSIHGTGLYQQGLSVTAVCTSCHTSHRILPHTDPESSIHRDNVAETCTQCHAQIERVHRKVIEGELWETEPHMIPACVECHSPHKIRRVFYAAGSANRDCLSCHQDENLTIEREGETVSLYVDELAYNSSTHSGTACAQCHTEVTSSLVRPCETINVIVNCSICHEDEVDQHSAGMHGRLAAEGYAEAPVCMDCHDNHATMSKLLPTSPTFPRNVPALCARCHREGEVAAVRRHSEIPDIVSSYEMSIHGTGLYESGLVVTATCSSCHTAHKPLPPDDPESSIHPDNVADTCGNCHFGIEEQFKTSVHWPENSDVDDHSELPTCEGCHTSHTISRTDKADFRLAMMDQCGRCHEEESETFFDTYHGKVSRLGDAGAAKCYDCHGTHNILPVTAPASTLSRRNILKTCAECHPMANRKFTGYLTHATHHDPDKYPFLWLAFWGMTLLLVGTLTFAMFHTLAWLYRLWRSPEYRIQHRPKPGEKLYRRFTTFQRTLHAVMMISFLTLALTGMALKFSYMKWAQITSNLLGGFDSMGLMHRMGATVLIGVFLIHLWDLRRQRKDQGFSWKQLILSKNSMMFSKTDGRQLIQSFKWFFGKGPRPKFDRFTYWERFDYFAVFWGMFIIGSTGLVLWFPEVFTIIFPGQAVNVATIIHSDEALLATGFIFTVHFFNTHFRLDKFPMDPVIFTGRISVEELKHDKPGEYEDLVASGKLDDHLVEPYPPNVEKGMKIFGFTALGLGLIIVFLIIFTMLFGYR